MYSFLFKSLVKASPEITGFQTQESDFEIGNIQRKRFRAIKYEST